MEASTKNKLMIIFSKEGGEQINDGALFSGWARGLKSVYY